MAKVKGPLFSIAATGEFRGMHFRTGSGNTTVAGPRETSTPRRPAQVAQSERFKTAITGWNALDDTAKAAWKAAAANTGMNGYQLYVSEFIHQAITAGANPILPV